MDQELKKKIYFEVLRIRMVEEAIALHYSEQEMRCPVHLCIGQEAIAVGVCANLSKEDYVMSTHRSHGHYLAKGGNLRAMLAEIYGKASGCSQGRGGSMHLVDLDAGFLGATPIVGSIIPIAVGIAFGTAMKGERKISVVFIGDAATEEGVFTESLNFASLKKLPVLFVCENNFYSVYSSLSVRQPPERDNLAIARAYGIYADRGDGSDIIDIYKKSAKAIAHLRKKHGPAYIEFSTYRWREHCGPNYDNDLGYRSQDEYMSWRNRCAVESLESSLIKDGIMTNTEVTQLKERIDAEINEAFSFAKSSPFPSAKDLFMHNYA